VYWNLSVIPAGTRDRDFGDATRDDGIVRLAATNLRERPHLLLAFAVLQLCDLITTLTFLHHGVQEANPLVRYAMQTGGQPVGGLILAKISAAGLALFCWRSGRIALLRKATIGYGLLIVWNLIAIAVS
jgi:hypothetical protein